GAECRPNPKEAPPSLNRLLRLRYRSHCHPDILSQITSVIGGPDQKAIADTGSSLLSTLLGGSGLNGLGSAISTFAGRNQNARTSVLGLIGPRVMGALGQQQRSGGLDANGLANLLSSQKDQITA